MDKLVDIIVFSNEGSGVSHNRKHRWLYYNGVQEATDIVFYIDKKIAMENKIGRIKIAWLFEPQEINELAYHYVKKNPKEFTYIFTWDKSLLSISDNVICFPYGTSYVGSECNMYPKSKLVSIIASDKNFLPGHGLRHEAIRKYKDRLGLFGRGYNPIDKVLPAYEDYMFTIVIENVLRDYNITEKLISPMLCGTVPIYWGCPSVGDFFDIRGILQFETMKELDDIMNSITPEKYNEMLPYIKNNCELARKYQRSDDIAFEKLVELGLVKDA